MFEKLTLLLAVMAATSIGAATAHALTTSDRTFVSNAGLAGNTNAGCSAASPCDTFAHALSVTNAGGEINCLNAGDFGTVTITKAVTINCEDASNGGITASGSTAITVNTTGEVNLIGLAINGMNATGGNGVVIQSNGVVNVRNCKIYGFLQSGLFTTGNGVELTSSAAGGTLVVDDVFVAENTFGIYLFGNNGAANMTVRNSNINNNSQFGIIVEMSGGSHAGATIEQTTLAFNGTALEAFGSGAITLIGGSTLVNNGTGVSAVNGGAVYSFKNNQIGGNSSDATPLAAYPGGPLN